MTVPFIDAADLDISGDDAVLGATGVIQSVCNWHIFPVIDDTAKVHSDDGVTLVLPTLKLVSVTSVTWADGDDSRSLDVDVDLADDDQRAAGVLRRVDGGCWRHSDVVTVQFKHGYAELPAALRAVIQTLAKRWPLATSPWTTRRMGSAMVSIGSGPAMIPVGGLTNVEKMILAKFTLPSRP